MTSTSRSPRRAGFLYPGHRDPEFDSWRRDFLAALEDFSWTEGSNLLIEWRFAEYDRTRYAPLAGDPAWAGVDVLVTAGTPLTHALTKARPSTSIVTGVGDPVGSGFATSLESPGLNITGLSWALREQELVAEVRKAESVAEIESALENLAGPLTGAAIIYGHGAFQFDESTLARAAIRHGIAAIGDERRAAEAGCLMSYGMHHADQARSFASLVDRVLRGEKPSQMPFELPGLSEFVVNRATAASLGLALSPELLHRADAVIG